MEESIRISRMDDLELIRDLVDNNAKYLKNSPAWDELTGAMEVLRDKVGETILQGSKDI